MCVFLHNWGKRPNRFSWRVSKHVTDDHKRKTNIFFFKLSKKYYLDNFMLSLTYERWLSQKQRVVGAPEGSSGMSAGRCSRLRGVTPQPHCGLPLWLLQPPPQTPPTPPHPQRPTALTRRHTGGRSQREGESVDGRETVAKRRGFLAFLPLSIISWPLLSPSSPLSPITPPRLLMGGGRGAMGGC